VAANGNAVLVQDSIVDTERPLATKDASSKEAGGDYQLIVVHNIGPPIREGEAIIGEQNIDDTKTNSWVYLIGQRRVRKLPNPCCDTPNPVSGGMMMFDEFYGFSGRMNRFDWKILGKKEIYIPYNTNRVLVPPKVSDVMGTHFMNPNSIRWELHRVWVVEADLAPGQRHQVHKGVYYVDEDSWLVVFGDRWDSGGRLWKTIWTLPMVDAELPAVTTESFGYYDLVSGTWFAMLQTGEAEQFKLMPAWPKNYFSPDTLSGGSLR
jgi:hypothetical protein